MLSKNRCKDSKICSILKGFSLFLVMKIANNYSFTWEGEVLIRLIAPISLISPIGPIGLISFFTKISTNFRYRMDCYSFRI